LPGQRNSTMPSLPQWALHLALRTLEAAWLTRTTAAVSWSPNLIDGKPATTLNGGTIGFLMSDAKQAEAWHNAGVANGGTSIEDPPGVRPNGAYLAYLRDPDGHKLVGVAR
jgi:catechol 2,3-dioxygenase-like lactoylglutathione lyase family enzyme